MANHQRMHRSARLAASLRMQWVRLRPEMDGHWRFSTSVTFLERQSTRVVFLPKDKFDEITHSLAWEGSFFTELTLERSHLALLSIRLPL